MAVHTSPTRSLDLPIRRARVELTPATRGLASVDGWLYVAIAAICAFGLVMVYSASEVLAYDQTGNPSYYFERQCRLHGDGRGHAAGARPPRLSPPAALVAPDRADHRPAPARRAGAPHRHRRSTARAAGSTSVSSSSSPRRWRRSR